jgi:hypothetical protein
VIKNEYHNLVSPIVLKGGWPRSFQRRKMKRRKSESPERIRTLAAITDFLLIYNDIIPSIQNSIDTAENHIKLSHIICYLLSRTETPLQITSLSYQCMQE